MIELSMELLVGLGNPGTTYKDNRHNAGYMLVDVLKNKSIKNKITLKKSDVFMNSSGKFVGNLLAKYKLSPDNLYVAHDDLDLKIGEYKIQFGKGPKIHNGLRSIDETLGTDKYWHIRIGVDGRDPENRTKGEEYVLNDFSDNEKEVLGVVLNQICKKLEML